MNPINVIRSYFLMLKASALQGRGQFEDVIEISTRARKLHPKSQIAFLMLADDLIRLQRPKEAKSILEEALNAHPKDCQFNIWYAQLLMEEGAPIEKIVPYAQRYIDKNPKPHKNIPFYMNTIMRVFGKPERIENLKRSMNSSSDENYCFAESVIRTYSERSKAT